MEDLPVSLLNDADESNSTSTPARTVQGLGPMIFLPLLLCFASVLMVRAGQTSPSASANSEKKSVAATHGVDLSILDKTCKPCDDFYHYASGKWLKNNPVPA